MSAPVKFIRLTSFIRSWSLKENISYDTDDYSKEPTLTTNTILVAVGAIVSVAMYEDGRGPTSFKHSTVTLTQGEPFRCINVLESLEEIVTLISEES